MHIKIEVNGNVRYNATVSTTAKTQESPKRSGRKIGGTLVTGSSQKTFVYSGLAGFHHREA